MDKGLEDESQAEGNNHPRSPAFTLRTNQFLLAYIDIYKTDKCISIYTSVYLI